MKTILTAVFIIALLALGHDAYYKERKCLELGNAPEQCAKLKM